MENLKLYKKLLAIQAEIKPIVKDEKNTAFGGFKYYDINSLLAEIKPILTKHGVILTQAITMKDGLNCLVTLLIDAESGEEMESIAPLAPLVDAQKFGGLVTYMRRYALTALFALESEDDDGNVASGTPAQPSPAKSATGGTEKTCVICSTNFTPNPQYPYVKTCSAKCGMEAKRLKAAAEVPLTTQPSVGMDEEVPFA